MVQTSRPATLTDYFAVFKRRKWLVLLVTVATVAAAVGVSFRQTPRYAASSTVLVVPNPLTPSGAGSAAADAQARYVSTQALLAHTLDVAQPAAQASGVRGVSGDDLLTQSNVTSGSSNNILTFTVEDRNPAVAVRLANAFARQFTV